MIPDSIAKLFKEKGVEFEEVSHAPVRTSEEAFNARPRTFQKTMSQACTALILLSKGKAFVAVLPADKRLDSKKFRKIVSVKNLRFASTDEALELTGFTPGGIPPFGHKKKLPVYFDKQLLKESFLVCNVTPTNSVKFPARALSTLTSGIACDITSS